MDRATLAEMLHSDWPADVACRQAILDGAPFEIWEHGPTPVDHLVHIYGLRERHTRQKGIPSIGFADAVTRLRSCGLDAVLIGYVEDVEHRRHFQLFVAVDQSHVVSCLSVDQRRT